MSTITHTFPQTNIWIPPPMFHNHQQRYSFDNKILLVAVLCLVFVIILVALLHLFVYSAPRHRRRTFFVNTSDGIITGTATQDPQTNNSGVDPSVLAVIPTFPYRSRGEAQTGCAVCLSPVEDGEVVRLLPGCKHAFHLSCIDVWLHAHCTCPMCRATVVSPEVAAGGVEVGTSSFRIILLSGRQWSRRRAAGHGDGEREDLESPVG